MCVYNRVLLKGSYPFNKIMRQSRRSELEEDIEFALRINKMPVTIPAKRTNIIALAKNNSPFSNTISNVNEFSKMRHIFPSSFSLRSGKKGETILGLFKSERNE